VFQWGLIFDKEKTFPSKREQEVYGWGVAAIVVSGLVTLINAY
jgi:hypothetical protein